MRIIQDTTEFYIEQDTAVAFGKFDGVHSGHAMLIDQVVEAKKEGLLAVAFTFDPSPNYFFMAMHEVAYEGELTTREEKRKRFAELGIDILIEFPLTQETAGIMPEEFAENYLVKRLRAKKIYAGDDVSFGYKGAGNKALLDRLGKILGYSFCEVSKLLSQGREVSSTYIRSELSQGNLEKVNLLLGYTYSISGPILPGKQIGRNLGFPTVNMNLPEGKYLPPNGVYVSSVVIGQKTYLSISNLGTKPTVSDAAVKGLETYIREYSGDLYGEMLTVSLHHYIRPEMTFASAEELATQIQKDLQAAIDWTERM